MTPHEVYFGRKLNMTHIRVFGHMAYVHVLKEKRKKLNTKAEECILIVYSDAQKGCKCHNPQTREVHVSRGVVFFTKKLHGTLTPIGATHVHSEPNSDDKDSIVEYFEVNRKP